MKAFLLFVVIVASARTSIASIVPDDYRTRIISEVLSTKKLASEGSYKIVFSPPAYVTVGHNESAASNAFEGAVRFRVTWIPVPKKNTMYHTFSIPEVAVFDKNGKPTVTPSVHWLFGAPTLDETSATALLVPPH